MSQSPFILTRMLVFMPLRGGAGCPPGPRSPVTSNAAFTSATSPVMNRTSVITSVSDVPLYTPEN